MTEQLLQFIWRFQYFNRNELSTTSGETVHVVHPGLLNTDQGPDFLGARIKIGNTLLAGSVELHLQSSLWKKHRHHKDNNYRNVILHVVLENDCEWEGVPTLVLQNRIPHMLLQQYEAWMQNGALIPCAGSLHRAGDLVWTAWKERLLAERLQRKSAYVLQLLQQNRYHWEDTFWQLLARNFGAKINADAFEAMARSVPVTLLSKHKHQLQVLEALLMGQAGLLEESFDEAYPQLLQREYQFWRQKYRLTPSPLPVHFLRMRPASFPTVRLAQLAMLVHRSSHLFSKLRELAGIKDATALVNTTANDYWHSHYRFGETAAFRKKQLGREMINSLVVNTLTPVLFAYGLYHNVQQFKDRAMQWLAETGAEANAVTRGWQRLGIACGNAQDSQALTELKTQYCSQKKCLECAIGNALLKKAV